ncbi:Forkhead-associated protein [Isosphaera pallida ATCC 43644]|uniref:Forkhead-associated protein n=1 Tax=Isosphaera pallida (strain ATCC 43644 / DSM 9630 / IS1B) TaxID=575540 RepID=E8R1Y7_ISOPI|nr:FHA domain-containing protein [Isosphaera pallida]ADV62419.1 Forkhead-associated protein [Isosphaera pallida ATCC 43644]
MRRERDEQRGRNGFGQGDPYSLDQMRRDLGVAGPLGLRYKKLGWDTTRRKVWPQPFVVVGSGPRVDLYVADPDVPRRSVLLLALGSRLLAVGLNAEAPVLRWVGPTESSDFVASGDSSLVEATGNGGSSSSEQAADPGSSASSATVAVSGRPLLERGWLTERNGLALGSYLIGRDDPAVAHHDQPDPFTAVLDPTETESGLDVDLPRTVLVISNSAGEVVRSPAHRVLTLIGSDHPCHLRIRAKGVSRFHAALVLTPAGGWLIDLSGHDSALTVDGLSVRAVRFDEGRELTLGDHRLGVRYGSELRRVATIPSGLGLDHARGQVTATTARSSSDFESRLAALSRLAIPTVPDVPGLAPSSSNGDPSHLGHADAQPAPQDQPTTLDKETPKPTGSDSSLERYFLRRQLELDQMRSRFAETVLTTTDLLRDLRDDQSHALRREYEEVRRLSEEIRRLTARLTDTAPPPNLPRSTTLVTTGEQVCDDQTNQEGRADTPLAWNGIAQPRCSGTLAVPAWGLRKATPLLTSPPQRTPPHHSTATLTSPPAAPLQDTLPPPDVQQIHFGLFQKITRLQSERESRFQKLMGMLGLTS